jgi:hypothetical protein
MSQSIETRTEDIEVYLLSIQAVKGAEILNEGKQVSINTHHIPTMIQAASVREAERIGNELAEKRFPADEGWECDVVVVPIILSVIVNGTLTGNTLDLQIKLEPKLKEEEPLGNKEEAAVDEREEIITDVMEIFYEVLSEAQSRMNVKSRKNPLVAATNTPGILRDSLDSIFSQMYPAASEQLDKRIMETRGVKIDEEDEGEADETDSAEKSDNKEAT